MIYEVNKMDLLVNYQMTGHKHTNRYQSPLKGSVRSLQSWTLHYGTRCRTVTSLQSCLSKLWALGPVCRAASFANRLVLYEDKWSQMGDQT